VLVTRLSELSRWQVVTVPIARMNAHAAGFHWKGFDLRMA